MLAILFWGKMPKICLSRQITPKIMLATRQGPTSNKHSMFSVHEYKS